MPGTSIEPDDSIKEKECDGLPSPKRSKLEVEEGKTITVPLEDPSEYRPEFRHPDLPEHLGKKKEEFRVFHEESGSKYDIVKKTYTEMHHHQNMETVKRRMEKWCSFKKAKMTMMEAIELLDLVVDESDPDALEPNSVHAFQTAERIRQAHPDEEWMHLVGLIHDAGKVLAVWGEPQWAVVGDTFPVGCAFSDSCVFPETFEDNPDSSDSRYNTECGMYKRHCGLDAVQMSFGHDEYLYQVLRKNGCTLPEPAFYMVRYHSFYPWHSGGAYDHLCSDKDREMLTWIRKFNKFDLYSKADIHPNKEELKPYYQALIDKYCPGMLCW